MSSDVWAAVVGGAAGLVTAGATSFFTRRKTAAETLQAMAEAERARAEAREINARVDAAEAAAQDATEELRDRVANAEASIAYERAQARSVVAYRSSESGFSLFDFELQPFDGAAAELRLGTSRIPDDVLVLLRSTADGGVNIWLKSYGYRDVPDAIPVRDTVGVHRTLRVQCELRALGAQHTVLFVLKQLDAPLGAHLATRRERLLSESWLPMDAAFSVVPSAEFRLRLTDRNVSAAPSRVEIRNLVVTERNPPAQLMG